MSQTVHVFLTIIAAISLVQMIDQSKYWLVSIVLLDEMEWFLPALIKGEGKWWGIQPHKINTEPRFVLGPHLVAPLLAALSLQFNEQARTRALPREYTHTHTYVLAHTHIQTQAHAHRYTHTHTRARALIQNTLQRPIMLAILDWVSFDLLDFCLIGHHFYHSVQRVRDLMSACLSSLKVNPFSVRTALNPSSISVVTYIEKMKYRKLAGESLLWAQSTTNGFIRAGDKCHSTSQTLRTKVLKPQNSSKSTKLVSTQI